MGVGWTSIGALSEVWVGGRRGTDSGSDWGDHLRTTGTGTRTTLDLTHARNSLGFRGVFILTNKTKTKGGGRQKVSVL